jgi:two-component SAPR family response regulator
MAKEIREINKKIPIILITSENINDILHDKDLTDNTNEIIEKPVCEPILKKLIEKYL